MAAILGSGLDRLDHPGPLGGLDHPGPLDRLDHPGPLDELDHPGPLEVPGREVRHVDGLWRTV
jgi:hypothetical protein